MNGLNLHGVASGVLDAVNPRIPAVLKASKGWTETPDGHRLPVLKPQNGMIQVQGITAMELAHLSALNITGVLRKVYLDGDWNAIVRSTGQGGDLFSFGGHDWLVVHVLETWPEWSAVIVSQQVPK
jgi:hypothetical protein